ncbi:hypothetical protein [Gaopeijia maritima]|uniref:hypothetical protein n=1 Tax=Gaopeijia maritima TaxID=3119007 RepID=UPI0032879DD2
MPAENRMSPEERQAIAMAATAVPLVLAGIFAGVVATLIYVEVLVLGVAYVG